MQIAHLLKDPHTGHFFGELRAVLGFAVIRARVIGIDRRAVVFPDADVMAARCPVTFVHVGNAERAFSEFGFECGHAGGLLAGHAVVGADEREETAAGTIIFGAVSVSEAEIAEGNGRNGVVAQ